MKYPHLFTPLKIGGTIVKNRIALAPINNASQMDPITGQATMTMVDYFAERARGGAGMMLTGTLKVEYDVEQTVDRSRGVRKWTYFSPQSVRMWGETMARAHAYDSKVFLQLSAGPGRVTPADTIRSGVVPVSASENECFFAPDVTTRALETGEVEQIVAAFGRAAAFARSVNADGIEVHGHEGYLIDQFTTPLWNRRTDKYGGDLEGRLRFPMEILHAIKSAAGDDFPVIYRMSARHFIEAPMKGALRVDSPEIGRDIDESVELAQRLEAAGYDGFDVDLGAYESSYWAHPPLYFPHGFGLELTAAIKDAVDVPVIVAGRLGIPSLAEKALADGKLDVVALGRDLLADPEWPLKAARGEDSHIRPCIACHDGCIERPRSEGTLLSCTVNPSTSRERVGLPTPTMRRKRILVAGGGAAGMEFARVASMRGHEVSLYEATDELGGHILEYGVPDFKSDTRRLLEWYRRETAKSDVSVRLGQTVTPALVDDLRPDAVVVAAGSEYVLPDVGPFRGEVVACTDLLRREVVPAGRTLIVGGGSHGVETALWLARQGGEVAILEASAQLIATGVNRGNRRMLLDLLEELGVEALVGRRFSGFAADGVLATTADGDVQTVGCDTAVMAIGVSSRGLYGQLAGMVPEIYNIGDSKRPRKIHEAIFEGWFLGLHV